MISGVFGDTVSESVSVMEGDSVTLHTSLTEVEKGHVIDWSLIALINDPNTSCLYDGEDGRFRDRLKVDYETGSLNITDTTTEHTGRYEAELIRSESSGKSQSLNRSPKCNSTKIYKKNINPEDIIITFNLTVSGVFGDTDEVKSVSVLEGDSVTLQTGLNKEQYEVILWNFNDIQIAEYDQDIGAICLYDGEGGRFRDRLKVDYETGSLTITNITTEHAGRYEADIIRLRRLDGLYAGCFSTKVYGKILNIADSTEQFTVTVSDPGLSSAAVAGISAGGVGVVVLVAVAVAAAVMIYHRRRSCQNNK
uniref:Immunoglobulin domain-containing protein n=1 Tax=Cyprinus carpio TaxID=7962 RepID=A0A8C1KM69_CYPCA